MTLPLRRVDRLRGRLSSTDLPDFIDLDQLTVRMSVADGVITRLRKRRRFPPPDRHFQSQELWWWPHVALWTRQRGGSIRSGPPPAVVPVVDLVGLREIATRLKVPVKVLQYWIGSGRFPAPDYRWSTTEAWLWETVDSWTRSEHRRPSDTPLWAHLKAKVATARSLVAQGSPTPRLRRLIEEVAAEEAALLGTSALSFRDLSDADFLDRFESIRTRLDELAVELGAADSPRPADNE